MCSHRLGSSLVACTCHLCCPSSDAFPSSILPANCNQDDDWRSVERYGFGWDSSQIRHTESPPDGVLRGFSFNEGGAGARVRATWPACSPILPQNTPEQQH